MKLKSVNPFTGEVTAEFDPLSDEACRDAVLKGQEAFGKWRKLGVSDRLKPVAKLASIFRQNKEEYARIIAVEMGKPIGDGMSEIEKCAGLCDYYYRNAEAFLSGETVETEAAGSYIVFDPLGVILGIMPWNFPFWQVARWAVPTLAAGNVCVLKHASNVPLTALRMEKNLPGGGFSGACVPDASHRVAKRRAAAGERPDKGGIADRERSRRIEVGRVRENI